jgi:hypothetical protein
VGDKKLIPPAKVNKKGDVVCPHCAFKTPVPETHSLSQGIGLCAACKKRFLVDDECVMAFHHFLSKQGSQHSKDMTKNADETSGAVKEMQDGISEGGLFFQQGE